MMAASIGMRFRSIVSLLSAALAGWGAAASFPARAASIPPDFTEAVRPPWARAGKCTGRVLVREGGTERYRGRVGPGFELGARDAVLTGPGARVEWLQIGGGRWRLGERVVWLAGEESGEAVLRAGTALAVVPPNERWDVGAAETRVRISEGVWLLTAVDNGGLKIVALDGGELSGVPADGIEGAPLRLRAGELIFARPGGEGFGPVVTIFLEETLATSRLLTRFGVELPQMERLRQQAAAQRERLTHVSNAHVGGARDADGFQVIVPDAGSAPAGGPR
jgi:hypothetical protein